MRLSGSIALFLCFGCLAQEKPSTPSFEVASVKPASPGAQYAMPPHGGTGTSDPGMFTAEAFTPKQLITLYFHLREFQVSGPAWIGNTRYDIAAKVAPAATKGQLDLMMQSLLADRFSLKFHYEKKTHAAYELAVDKRGFKLKPPTKETDVGDLNKSILAAVGQKAMISTYSVEGGRGITAIAATIDDFRRLLENELDGAPVLDKTALSGPYDFRIRYAPGNGASDSALPSLFTGVEECCGLKLQPVKAQFDVMVIDHIEPPSGN